MQQIDIDADAARLCHGEDKVECGVQGANLGGREELDRHSQAKVERQFGKGSEVIGPPRRLAIIDQQIYPPGGQVCRTIQRREKILRRIAC